MKKIYLSLIAIVFAINFSYAQWTGSPGDIYYNTGNVSIGTTNFLLIPRKRVSTPIKTL